MQITLKLFDVRGQQTFAGQVAAEEAQAIAMLELNAPIVDMKQAEDGRGEYVAVKYADGTAAIVEYMD